MVEIDFKCKGEEEFDKICRVLGNSIDVDELYYGEFGLDDSDFEDDDDLEYEDEMGLKFKKIVELQGPCEGGVIIEDNYSGSISSLEEAEKAALSVIECCPDTVLSITGCTITDYCNMDFSVEYDGSTCSSKHTPWYWSSDEGYRIDGENVVSPTSPDYLPEKIIYKRR